MNIKELTEIEQKYSFALDMLVTFGKVLGNEKDTKEDIDDRITLLLENFDVDEASEILINKKQQH